MINSLGIALVPGGIAFAGAKYIFSASTRKAVVIGVAVAALAFYLASQRPPPVNALASPDVP